MESGAGLNYSSSGTMEGKLHRAHRVVLAVNSGYFSRVLEQLPHGEPVVYMRGVDSGDLRVVMDLLYTGWAMVTTDRLGQVEHLVEELKMGNIQVENRAGEVSDCNENIASKPRGDTADQSVTLERMVSAEKDNYGLVGAKKKATGKLTRRESFGEIANGVVPAMKDTGVTIGRNTARKNRGSNNNVGKNSARKGDGAVVEHKMGNIQEL